MSWLPGLILAAVLVLSIGYFVVNLARGFWMIVFQGRDPVAEKQLERRGRRRNYVDHDSAGIDSGAE